MAPRMSLGLISARCTTSPRSPLLMSSNCMQLYRYGLPRAQTYPLVVSSQSYSTGPQTAGSQATPRWLYSSLFFASGIVAGGLLLPTLDKDISVAKARHTEESVAKPLSDTITGRLNADSDIISDQSSPVTACHSARVASNSPCEDQLAHGLLSSTDGLLTKPWHAWAIFDGHVGSQTAQLLKSVLIPAVEVALGRLPVSASDDTVGTAITNAFVDLDDDIVIGALEAALGNEPYHERVAKLALGYSGSCALVSLLDPKTWTLRVACVGDSRAVLGRQDANGTWSAEALSIDQTGSNEEEAARINAEHPGESGIVKAGRVLGIMVSRGFGDGRWKWDLDSQKMIKEKYDAFSPLPPDKYAVKTPPYLNAQPVVTTIKLDKERPSFLIMASDGFWDRVSNDEAVKLVTKWLSTNGVDAQRHSQKYTGLASQRVEHSAVEVEKYRHGKPGFLFTESRTALQDDNAAVHLIRNCLGGNLEELVAANLLIDPPFSRHVRDDITVQVIFLDPKNREQ